MAEKQEDKRKPLGLKTENGNPVPLKSIKVDVHIIGYVAEVSSRLTYFNEEETPVEAVFTFPVDDGSAVFQFEAHIDKRHIVAEIQEKEQAKLTYKDAIEHGKTAMLLKEDNSAGDIFCCMLGNLPPHGETSLVMKYVNELPQEADGRLRFTLPTVLNPRYSPDVGGLTAGEGATYVPPCKVGYEFSMAVTVEGFHKVTSVTSDRMKLDVKYGVNNKKAKVAVNEEFKFDHDLGLLVQYETPYSPQVILETGNPEAEGLLKEDMLMVSFHPDLKEVAMATNGEYIFVIDRSGSMRGDEIKNAKDALLLFLKSLPPDCYFNIVSFGSTHSSLFSNGSKEYTKENLGEAIKLQTSMDANMGGTEILSPLDDIFQRKLIKGHPRRVFVLTDGGVSNTDHVLGLVKTQSLKTSTRVFSLGIGHGVSTALVKGIANNGGGKAEFIVGGDRVQSKVVSLLKCAMQPAITDVTINWDLPPDVTPVSIPTEPPTLISIGERLTLFAVLQGVKKEKDYPESSVTLKGQQVGKPVTYSLNFALGKSSEVSVSAPVHRLATKVQIKLLQDEESARAPSYTDGPAYYTTNVTFTKMNASLMAYIPAHTVQHIGTDTYHISPDLGNGIKTFRQRIVDLSRHGNIVSKYSAFVAIDTEGKKVENKAVERSCPVPTLSEEYMSGIQPVFPVLRTGKGRPIDATFYAFGPQHDSSQHMMYCNTDKSADSAQDKQFYSRSAAPIGDLPLKSTDSAQNKQFYSRSAAPIGDPPLKSTDSAQNKQFYSRSAAPIGDLPLKSTDSAQNKQFYSRSAAPIGDLPLKSADSAQDKQFYNRSTAPIHQRKKKGFGFRFRFPSFGGLFSKKSRDKDYNNSKCYEEPAVDQSVSQLYSEMSSDADGNSSLDDKMMSVIALQQLHGEWEVSGQLLKLLGIPKEEFDTQKFSEVPSIVCTVIVLCWLRRQFSHRQEEWQMIETKALIWLASQKLSTPVEDIIQQTTQSLWSE